MQRNNPRITRIILGGLWNRFRARPRRCYPKTMGLTHVAVTVANPTRPRWRARLSLLLDSGAQYSVVPEAVLKKLGIVPRRTESLILAGGTEIKRRVGEARFVLDGNEGVSPVIFGEKDDGSLLGVVSLEVMGLMLDPLQRKIRPMRLML